MMSPGVKKIFFLNSPTKTKVGFSHWATNSVSSNRSFVDFAVESSDTFYEASNEAFHTISNVFCLTQVKRIYKF